MDLKEMRGKKRELEEALSGVIREFERKTGLRVREVRMTHMDLVAGFAPNLETTSYLAEVRTTVEV